MKAEKLRGLEDSELEKQSQGHAEGMKMYRELKKDRARILTILRERQGK